MLVKKSAFFSLPILLLKQGVLFTFHLIQPIRQTIARPSATISAFFSSPPYAESGQTGRDKNPT
jgi:hypothetical protein